MKTLIVEDVDVMRELLSQVVGALQGYSVSALAANTVEARFELGRRRPELVLLDEILPGESSLELLEELRIEQIPVLLLTSLENRTVPLPPGALGRLFKPGWKTLQKDIARLQREMDHALGKTAGKS